MARIRFTDVSVTVESGAHTILHPFSLELNEQRISLIGANGSGKSTFARLVNGLVMPASGRVSIEFSDGNTYGTDRESAHIRARVGFVFTDANAQLIMPTVLEDVALSLRKRYKGARERERAALKELARFKLDGFADRSVYALSGGQKQLLAFVTVLAANPQIIVADEPTTLLDLKNSRAIEELMFSLPQQLLVATHDLQLAARADRTLLFNEGRIIFDGPPAEAIARYRALI